LDEAKIRMLTDRHLVDVELAEMDGEQSAIWTTHPVIPLRIQALSHYSALTVS
jgi:Zn-dependent protease with chaperone function